MDKHKQFLIALEKANHEATAARRKKELKLWIDLSIPYSLKDALNRLTKAELDKIRQNLELKNLSTLKKSDLIHELSVRIPERMEDLLFLMDEERYDFVLQIVENGGAVEASDLSLEKSEYLRSTGLFFPGNIRGERVLTMPTDLIDLFKTLDGPPLKKEIHRNTEIIQLTHGLLHYYGILQITQLQKMILELTKQEDTSLHLIRLLFNSVEYYKRIQPTYHVGFYDARIDDHEHVLKAQKQYPELDYYPFTKGQILNASNPFHIDVTPALKALVDFFLTHYEMTQEEAGELALDCVDFVRYDLTTNEILKFLEHEVQLPLDTEELLIDLNQHLIDLKNSTRLWSLKGYTYNETHQLNNLSQDELKSMKQSFRKQPLRAEIIDFKTRKRIGPEDPCPCGSGSKLKDCCS